MSCFWLVVNVIMPIVVAPPASGSSERISW